MNRYFPATMLMLASVALGCGAAQNTALDVEPPGRGPYSVGSTNMEIAPDFANIGDAAMAEYLLGSAKEPDGPRFFVDILRHPKSAWVVEVPVPDQPALYGPASGLTLPVVTYLTYPSRADAPPNSYTFPYHDGEYGIFEDMLDAGETPRFADPDARYPLVILAHGSEAHGIYDVGHAHNLSSHGYIVAVISYGDDRTAYPDDPNHHVSFMRPLLTKAVLDSILESETFGPHIDAENIGITGHSFGGFTALAVAGGAIQGNTASVTDVRIKAGVLAAPWVGNNDDGRDMFAFGNNNSSLSRVTAPMIVFFASKDDVTPASFILPAAKKLAGPTYVVELVDQPHVFEGGSWQDRDNWELLFYDAYLKNDPAALAMLKVARSMQGGNEDRQLFDYQKQ